MLLVLFAATVRPAHALHEPIASVARGPQIAEVVVNGVVVFRLAGPQASARAAAVAARLRGIPLRTTTPVTVDAVRPIAAVLAGGTHVITIDRADAAGHHTTARALARVWAQRLRQALATPSLAVVPAALAMIPGERLLVRAHVFPAVPLVVGQFDTEVTELIRHPEGFMVLAKAVGTTVIPLRAGAASHDLAVSVRHGAAALPAAIEVTVTGNPSDPVLVSDAIRHGILRATGVLPGSVIGVGSSEPAALLPGETQTLEVPVEVRSPFARHVWGVVRVTVRNVSIAVQTPSRLLVSNHPETVTANGVLFAETLQAGEAVRLLYHHRNGAKTARLVTVTLTNPQAEPARVLVIGAVAGPSTDVMYAGHIAAARFLPRLDRGQGYVIDVPAGRRHTFTVHEMPPGELVSGLLQVQNLSGRLHLGVHIRSPWLLERTVTSEVNEPAYPHPHGSFAASEVSVAASVRAGETALVTNLGLMLSPLDPVTGVRLAGDYGVLYRVTLDLVNSTDLDARFALVATAASGPARGMVLVDGEPADLGFLRQGQERTIASVTVPARDRRQVTVLTMPVAGSFYPVRLVVRPDAAAP